MILDKIKRLNEQLQTEKEIIDTLKLPALESHYRTLLQAHHPYQAYHRHYQKSLQSHALRLLPIQDEVKWHTDSLFNMGLVVPGVASENSSEIVIRESVMKRVEEEMKRDLKEMEE